MPRNLHSLLSYVCRDYPDLVRFQRLLPYVPINIRKALMTICRVQQDPAVNNRLYKAIAYAYKWSTSVPLDSTQTYTTFQDHLLPVLTTYVTRPVFLGYISMILRVIPLDDEESAIKELQNGIDKEVECATSSDMDQALDYRCLIPGESVEEWTLHPWLPERKELSLRFRRSLETWRWIVFFCSVLVTLTILQEAFGEYGPLSNISATKVCRRPHQCTIPCLDGFASKACGSRHNLEP
jgi:hypothetical protein